MRWDNGLMPRLPDGESPPDDGSLPPASLARWGDRPFGVYVHVPFCASRCGYCDFNTYTASELAESVDRLGFDAHLSAELRLARRVLGDRDVPVSSVFFGGGTPTLLAPAALARVLATVEQGFGLAPGVEVTVEANPDSVTRPDLHELRAAGVTRLSLGMQSAVPHVLAALDRTHTPGAALRAVRDAEAAGFDRISLDLIYGTPGESLADWAASLDAVLSAGVGHVSAYALIVEPGTRLASAVRRGDIDRPDDDLMADMYELADERFAAAAMPWYELSNWAREGQECRHNVAYWHGGDWWGVGPGAHSHLAGTRWWNAKHPAEYVRRLASDRSPAVGREILDEPTRQLEALMLGIRTRTGVGVAGLDDRQRALLPRLQARGLGAVEDGRWVLSRAGRLLADAVVRDLAG